MKTPRVSRFHEILLSSGVLIGLVVVVSGLAVGRLYERHMVTREEERIAGMVRSRTAQGFAGRDFELSSPEIKQQVFEALLRGLSANGVFRIKVYDRAGQIVWSDEPNLIGMAFPEDDPYPAEALKGNVTTVFQAPSGPAHVFESVWDYVAEVHVPISLPGSPGILGSVETYRDAVPVVQRIRRAQRWIWGVAGSMGLFLYGGLAFIVWTASSNERRAISRLAEAHTTLLTRTEELERANAALREAQARLVEKERLAAVGEVVVELHRGVLSPLTGILGALQVLKQEGITPEKAEALAQAEAEVRQIEGIVLRLSALRRVTAAAYVGDTTMLDLQRSTAEEEQG
jgi:hypothetical protein